MPLRGTAPLGLRPEPLRVSAIRRVSTFAGAGLGGQMHDDTAFATMRQGLVTRGLIDSDFRLTPAGNAYTRDLIARLDEQGPRTPKVASCVKNKPVEEAVEMRSMGHPDYEYQPHSEERRQRMSKTQRARLGIPEGHSRVYGIHVPDSVAGPIRKLAQEIAGKEGFDAAHAFVARASANEWRIDAAPAVKPAPEAAPKGWTPERRKAASEAAKARHAERRARQEAEWQRQQSSPEARFRKKLAELKRENEARAQLWHKVKADIDEMEAVEKLLQQVRATFKKFGFVD